MEKITSDNQLETVLIDVNTRIAQLETDLRHLEAVVLKLIDTQKDLIAITRAMAEKVITEPKKKKKNGNGDLEVLYR